MKVDDLLPASLRYDETILPGRMTQIGASLFSLDSAT